MTNGAEITAEGEIIMDVETVNTITASVSEDLGPFASGRKGAINSLKFSEELIPDFRKHGIEGVDVHFEVNSNRIRAVCRLNAENISSGKIQALLCVSTALLSIWNSARDLESLRRLDYQFASIKNIGITSIVEY